MDTETAKIEPIGYINPQIPAFDVPSYPGQRYEALVPDTLDLEDRAALGINGITGPTAPEADHEIHFLAFFGRNPPMMELDYSSDVQGKLQESLPLLRLITGSDLNSEVDRCWMQVTLKMQGPDGLLYSPMKGRPWWGWQSGKQLGFAQDFIDAGAEHIANGCYNGRMLGAISLYHQLTGDDLWVETGQRLVEGMSGMADHRVWPGKPVVRAIALR